MSAKNIVAGILSVFFSSVAASELDELKKLQAEADKIHKKQIAEGRQTPPDNPDAWVAAGESGYVNCMLTVLAEGKKDSVTLLPSQSLPNLVSLAEGDPDLTAWAKKLKFPYAQLSAAKTINILVNSFEMQNREKGSLKTILVKNDGSPLAVLFKAERETETKGLKVSVLRPRQK